jgi:regulatory associated protein of mTOR
MCHRRVWFAACAQVALRWFCSRSLLRHEGLTKELIDRIPGKQTDRRTPLGELNWIFTAITDTIAWNVLPRDLFQKLFRQVRPPAAPFSCAGGGHS